MPLRPRSHRRPINPSIFNNSNKLRTKTVIPRVDTAPHGAETPTQGTLLLIGFRETSEPHPMGTRSSASSLNVIEYCAPTCCSSWGSCTFNMDQHALRASLGAAYTVIRKYKARGARHLLFCAFMSYVSTYVNAHAAVTFPCRAESL